MVAGGLRSQERDSLRWRLLFILQWIFIEHLLIFRHNIIPWEKHLSRCSECPRPPKGSSVWQFYVCCQHPSTHQNTSLLSASGFSPESVCILMGIIQLRGKTDDAGKRRVDCRNKLLSRQKRVGCSVQLGESDLDRSWDKLSFVISGKGKIWVSLQGGGWLRCGSMCMFFSD